MKRRYFTFALITIALLLSIDLGLGIIYADYYYNPFARFSLIQVYNTEPMRESVTLSKQDQRILKELERWAADQQSVLIFRQGTAGVGFAGNLAHLQSVFDIYDTIDIQESETQSEHDAAHPMVYLSDNPALVTAYVDQGIFLPGYIDWPVAGYYSQERLPVGFSSVDYLYSLAFATSVNGVYFSDALDLQGLFAIFKGTPYEVNMTRRAEGLNVTELLVRLVGDGFLSRSLLFALLGLVFSLFYCTSLIYRASERQFWIRHLFGLSYKYMCFQVTGSSLMLIIINYVLNKVILDFGLGFFSRADIRYILFVDCVISGLLLILANGIGLIILSQYMRKRGTR
ncbi:hypothetical protein HCH52_12090 [Oscillospiraceae bacterium HV4-5-C5C]|nr:hypothetical protein [Oscillospiraceae bacterium HV4-5-C5C]